MAAVSRHQVTKGCFFTSSSPSVSNVPMIKTEVLWEGQTSLVDSEVKFDPVCVSDDEDPPAVTTSVILTETNRWNAVDVHGQRFFTAKKGVLILQVCAEPDIYLCTTGF